MAALGKGDEMKNSPVFACDPAKLPYKIIEAPLLVASKLISNSSGVLLHAQARSCPVQLDPQISLVGGYANLEKTIANIGQLVCQEDKSRHVLSK